MSTVETPLPPPIKDASVVISVGTGIAVWSVHLFAVYAVVALACGRGWLDFTALGMSGLNIILLVLTIPAVILIAVAGVVSYRGWKKLRQDKDIFEEGRHKRYLFMMFSGLVLSILFGALVLMTLVPSFTVPPCQ